MDGTNDGINDINDINDISDINVDGGDGFESELEVIDLLISDASEAIDAGEYIAALEGFREALRLIRRLFGESLEISQIDRSINDIGELLES